MIAKHGPEVFYNGSIADALVREIKEFKGIVTKKDLQDYRFARVVVDGVGALENALAAKCYFCCRVKWAKPIKSKVGNLTIYTAPPPGSGAILTFIMNVLHGIVPKADQRIMWQTIVETFKWAYARRTELADPDYVDIGESAIYIIMYSHSR